jgi:hypothetical protein
MDEAVGSTQNKLWTIDEDRRLTALQYALSLRNNHHQIPSDKIEVVIEDAKRILAFVQNT